MSTAALIGAWVLFVATSVYGHVALKLAAITLEGEKGNRFWLRLADDPWALSAIGAWIASGVLWVLILRRSRLFEAMSISSIRYALVCVACAIVLHESIDRRQALGMVLITAGVLLVEAES